MTTFKNLLSSQKVVDYLVKPEVEEFLIKLYGMPKVVCFPHKAV